MSQDVTSLEHQGGRKVFWEVPKFFKLCPIVLNYAQHIFPGWRKIFWGLLPPCASPVYGPVMSHFRVTLRSGAIHMLFKLKRGLRANVSKGVLWCCDAKRQLSGLCEHRRWLSTTGVSKESIIKFLIGNRFHVKLRILSPENCKQSLQVKSW